jgi:hypothetical protein
MSSLVAGSLRLGIRRMDAALRQPPEPMCRRRCAAALPSTPGSVDMTQNAFSVDLPIIRDLILARLTLTFGASVKVVAEIEFELYGTLCREKSTRSLLKATPASAIPS